MAISNLKFYDREILRLLLKNGGSMAANQIAEVFKKLNELGLVENSADGERYIWKAWSEKKKLVEV
ncbi:MAG: hypothetical protein ACP5MB_11440 [bacterium]